jgi:hypothetical protein
MMPSAPGLSRLARSFSAVDLRTKTAGFAALVLGKGPHGS